MGIRESINNTAAKIFLGDRVKTLDALTNRVIDAYEKRPYMTNPEQFRAALEELDPQMIDLLVRQIENRGVSYMDYTNETIRLEVVRESREAYVWDVVTQAIVDLWTNYGFTANTEVVPDDDNAKKTWEEFWAEARNSTVLGQRSISVLSQETLVAGEIFFLVYINAATGDSTLRYLESEDVKEIIYADGDNKTPLYYVREYETANHEPITAWYPDWRATPDQLNAKKIPDGIINRAVSELREVDGFELGTTVKCIPVQHRKKGKSNRGWPLMTAGIAWSRAYKEFLQDRAAVSKAVATYVDKITAKGGQRAINAIKANLQSGLVTNPTMGYDNNPAPIAGSTWLQNEQLNRERMPLNTGAGDAEKDGAPMLAQAGLSGGVFSHYLGRGEAYRLATATSMEGPVLRNFNGYQLFWSSVWQDVCTVVLIAKEKYGNVSFDTYEAKVNLDPVILIDLTEIKSTGEMLDNFHDRGLVSTVEASKVANELLRVSLDKLGVQTAEIFDPEGTVPETEPGSADVEAGESQQFFRG
jgi:hypothetical protein